MATTFPTQIYDPSSPASIQAALLLLAEYVTTNITASSVANQQLILQAIQQTLFSMVDIVNAYQFFNLASQEYSLLLNVQGILSFLSIADQNLINARLTSLNTFATTVYPFSIIDITLNVNNLTNGLLALTINNLPITYDLTNYLVTFGTSSNIGETPPFGLAVNNLISNAQAMSTAWLDALNYLNGAATQSQLIAYNSVDRMYNCSQDTFNLISNNNQTPPNLVLANSFTATQLTQVWNNIVALPSILRNIAILYEDPSDTQHQLFNALKFVIYNLIYATNSVLATFVIPNNLQQPRTATINQNESLMDFANRTTGDYTQWTIIATANNLQPPYVGVTPATGIATPGQRLFLPPFSNNTPIGNYTNAFLGTDIDIGFPNTTMQTWPGGFTLVSGINNYIGALVRRVLTPLGSLLYHHTYGSRLPQEVGNVSTASEAMLSASYLKTSLLQDPRTQSVDQITAYPVSFGQIVLTALVTPYGNTSTLPLNLVLVPQKSALSG